MVPLRFPTAAAAELGGVTPKMLNNWRVISLLLPATPGTSKRGGHWYSFSDIVAMRAIRAMEPIAAHTLEPLRAMVAHLRARTDLSPTAPLASITLATNGHEVCELPGSTTLAALRKRVPPGPMLLLVPLDELVAELQPKVRAYLDKKRAA